jgi:large subunit ribosomal protein L9
MKIILVQDVEKLGDKGEILVVKNGYARNYLIPNKMAIMASVSNLKTWENERAARERREMKTLEQAKNVASELGKRTFTIKAKAGEEGKLFGSVTTQDIATAVLEVAKIELDKKKIELAEPIKRTGSHKVTVKLAKGVLGEINVEVAAE